mmetsp:Transcript_24246/g.43884  ORF Transcript_24246/g.43884 Transcript_24246/m.43884 type:complete len:200 (-) Transcript_24246:143-742(-)|eukprot:CAMPEP_0197661146 /NCGR_PEP_ID=MMETSP1338-20131121/51285_1 /TAXON_ID=43686 ORGANISM="Pelagodinium beii, Strain RCC1491" /NCGR_SAMPLE_ID=MMETSP1338 /ASSEMBLY_ACC=CAM_ASM_000754 /LENGTH=199 /DNA_ID=CAMNT_0043238653 /DNA_START=52 /DNA_END=651 /DNA_ORIENTATION=+
MGFGDASSKDKKAAKSAAADAEKKSAAEDASWAETDKGNLKKAARKDEAAAKADAKLTAKAEAKELERQEEEAMGAKPAAKKKGDSSKLTQAEIARRQALMAAMAKPKAKSGKKTEVVAAPKIEANTNREQAVGEASGLDGALSQLENLKKEKMTYAEFEARELEGIKAENPGLKMSQAKERCFKMWERSPDNPKNQEK